MKKITCFLLLFLPIGMLMQSCIYGDDPCGDLPDTLPFFQYDGILLEHAPRVNSATGSGTFLVIQATGVDYLAQRTDAPSPWRSAGGLLACSPLPDGYEGAKFPLDSVRVTSNRPFAPSRGIQFDLGAVLRNQETGTAISQTPQFEPFREERLFFEFTLPPDTLDVPFRFEVALFRSDGETLTATTGDMRWEQ